MTEMIAQSLIILFSYYFFYYILLSSSHAWNDTFNPGALGPGEQQQLAWSGSQKYGQVPGHCYLSELGLIEH